MTPAFRTSSFAFKRHRLVYDDYGEGERLVVYLHGLLIDSEINRGIAHALAASGNRVVLLDLLGHGRSDKPEHASAYRIDTYADQVFALLDELGVDEAVLGGMSLGANVSLFAASRQPRRVRGLVLEMPVLDRAVPPAALLFTPLLLLVHYARTPARWVSSLVRMLPATPSESINGLLHGAAQPPEVMSAILHGVLVGPIAPTQEERAGISAPTLVLAHRNDLIHPFDDAVKLAAQLPDAALVRARSPIELRLRPDRLTDVIAAFVEDVWTRPRNDEANPPGEWRTVGEGPWALDELQAHRHADEQRRGGEQTMANPRNPVRDVMSRGAISVDEKLTLRSLAAVLAEADIGTALVARPDGSVGVVSERDVVRALADGADPDEVWAADVMVDSLVIVEPEETVADVAQQMLAEAVRHVAVVDRGAIIGVVSARDLLPILADAASSERYAG